LGGCFGAAMFTFLALNIMFRFSDGAPTDYHRSERARRIPREWLSKQGSTGVRKFGLLMVSVAGMVFAGSAAMADAAPPPPAPAATDAVKTSDLDKMVCRTMAPATGTRIGARRECRTQREWDDIREQSAKDTDKMQGNRGIITPGKQ